jgi:uncharacterized damage-inducible protein DinB
MIPYGAKDLANAFRTVRKNTVQIAEDIPEDKYDFVAAPGVQSVGGLLRHIAFAPTMQEDMHREQRLTTLKGYDFGAMGARAAAEGKKLTSKAEIIAALRDEGAQFATWLESLDDKFFAEMVTDPAGQNPKSRFEFMLGVKEHEMHHRGQLMLIQRMLGVVPHLTRQREERYRQRQAAAAAAAAAGARG